METRRTRGIALFSVLLAMVFCLLMVGAFLQSNRDFHNLTRREAEDHRAEDALRSVYNFCRSSLERDKRWGTPFPKERRQSMDARLEWTEHLADPLDIEGKITGQLENGLFFSAHILNNMREPTIRDGVLPRTCRLRIRVYEGSGSHQDLLQNPKQFRHQGGAEVLVSNAALFDSGVIASDQIFLRASTLLFQSKDPLRNQVRSNSYISLPEVEKNNLIFQTLIQQSDGSYQPLSAKAHGGTVWAKGDIVFGPDNKSGPEILDKASAQSGARLIPKAKTQYTIPELQPEDIQEGTSKTRKLGSGGYIFSDFWVAYTDKSGAEQREKIPVLTRQTWHEGGFRLDEFFYLAEDIPNATHTDTRMIAHNKKSGIPVDSIPSQAHSKATFPLSDTDGTLSGLSANLAHRQIIVPSDVTFEVDEGDFYVGTHDAAYFDDPDEANKDYIEEPSTVLFQGVDGTGTPGRSTIRTLKGSIAIEGLVLGRGNLISELDVALWPNVAAIDSDEVVDLAVYAGRDVGIGSPDNTEVVKGVAAFRGLVYANRNFSFSTPSELFIEGALVARGGNALVDAGKHLHVVYNPDFLDDLLRPKVLERTRVELLTWRPGLR